MKIHCFAVANNPIIHYHRNMRKIVFIMVFLLITGAVFGQEYTVQGLPWGSTRNQVIAKLGIPFRYIPTDGTNENAERFVYRVNVSGFLAELFIVFDNNRMGQAAYRIGFFQNFNTEQLIIVSAAMTSQLFEKYGYCHEIMTIQSSVVSQSQIWHFDNFHIVVETINKYSRSWGINYYSDTAWEEREEEYEEIINEGRGVRYPYSGL